MGSAAALTGYPVHVAEQCLERLFEDNLVQPTSSGCFRFHPMVRDCADQMLLADVDAVERQEASRRLGRYLALPRVAEQWCPSPREPPSGDIVPISPCAME